MRGEADNRVGRWLAGWVEGVARRGRGVALAFAVATGVLGLYAATHLGVNTDVRSTMISPDLPSEQATRHFEALFPGLSDALLVVIDAPSPSRARDAARQLSERLRRDGEHVRSVVAPGTDPFFERNGLLYRTPDELEAFGDHLARLQPMLAELAARPQLETLTRLIERGLDQGVDDEGLTEALDRLGETAVGIQAGLPVSASWETMLLADSEFDPSPRRILIVEPVLRFDAILPAADVLGAIRRAAREADLTPEQGIQVRITGYPALNDEELRGLLVDVGVAGLFTFAMVLLILYAAMRSARMVTAAALTLVVGLVFTAAFATFAIGKLNLVSLTFAVLFLGLGVDFAIHLGMHYLEQRRAELTHSAALGRAAAEIGPSLALCALTTAIGFWSFMPTDYKGIAELGLISGVGMFVIFGLTVTLLPALLSSFLEIDQRPSREGRIPFEPVSAPRRPGLVGALAGLAAVGALLLSPGVRFDSNVVKMRNPDSESVRAWNDLLEGGTASPWYIDLVAPNLAAAEEQARSIEALPQVSRTMTLADFVPADQEEKREILDDVAFLFEGIDGIRDPAAEESAPLDHESEIVAIRRLRERLDGPELRFSSSPVARSSRRLAERLDGFLSRLKADAHPAAALAELQSSLFQELPAQLEKLQQALAPQAVTLEALPASLVSRMRASDGSARIQIFPRHDLNDDRALLDFVDAVVAVAPGATGLPVNMVAFGRTCSESLRKALTLAVVAIALLLLALWRRPGDVALALAPLLLASAWCVGVMVVFDWRFNFANVIVLPLLLGIGVDSGIHLVSRSRRSLARGESLAATTTGRAVFFSAGTTLLSFGSLAFSAHRGIASLGQLLVLGMTFTLVANLVVLPALIALRTQVRSGLVEPAPVPD